MLESKGGLALGLSGASGSRACGLGCSNPKTKDSMSMLQPTGVGTKLGAESLAFVCRIGILACKLRNGICGKGHFSGRSAFFKKSSVCVCVPPRRCDTI